MDEIQERRRRGGRPVASGGDGGRKRAAEGGGVGWSGQQQSKMREMEFVERESGVWVFELEMKIITSSTI